MSRRQMYTAIVTWNRAGFRETEEIDVEASAPGEARVKAMAILADLYQSGWTSLRIVDFRGIVVLRGAL